MTSWVDQQVLGLDVSVHDVVAMHIVEGSQQLVSVQLDEQGMNLLVQLLEMLLDAQHVRRDVIHHNVEMSLIRLVFIKQLGKALFLLLWHIDEVRMAQTHNVLVMHFTVDLQLSTLVLFILLDLLHCHVFASALKGAHPHRGEGADTTLDFLREFVSLLQSLVGHFAKEKSHLQGKLLVWVVYSR